MVRQRLFLGKGKATFKRRNHMTTEVSYVAARVTLNLLSYATMQRLGLYITEAEANQEILTKEPWAINVKTERVASLGREFPDVFQEGLSKCEGTKATLKLKEGAIPVYRRARLVAFASLAVVEQELDRLLNLGVIKPVKHAEWATPVMIVKTDGSVRLCVDLSTGLNEALQLHQHPLPVPEDIFATLIGGQVFAQIDLSDVSTGGTG